MKHDSTFSDFAARLRRFISEYSARDAADGEEAPGRREDQFNQLALELFLLQFVHNAAYRKLCQARNISPAAVSHWSQIPVMPAAAFKELDMTSLAEDERVKVFYSSGTTEQKPSRHFHCGESLRIYETSLLPWFAKHLLQEEGRGRGAGSSCLIILTPPPALALHSSLVHMFETVRRAFGSDDSRFTGTLDTNGAWTLDLKKLLLVLRHATDADGPVMILGTAFNFVQLLDHVAEVDVTIHFPTGSRVLETGGFKGRSRVVPKDELYSRVTERLGISRSHIVSEYGMSELSSQAYDWEVPSSGAGRVISCAPFQNPNTGCGAHGVTDAAMWPPRVFHFPPWARAQIVSPESGREVGDGETGLIRVFDLANVWSVMAIQTEDLGVRRGDGFELIGRAAQAEARGCSLMTA